MILNILFIVIGIVLVLWGADRLTDGAVAVAEKMKMPQIVIGLTIVESYLCFERYIRPCSG